MKVKNICFAYITPFHPERGGIGRVTHTLTLEFQRRGYNVFYLIYPSAITVRHEYDYPAPLEYLPSSDCLSEENVNYYLDYLKRNKIDVVINQSGNFKDSELWCKAREAGIKVISVLHSDPLVSYDHIWNCDVAPLRNGTSKEKIKRIGRILLYPKIKRALWLSRKQHFEKLLPISDVVCTLSPKYFKQINRVCPGYVDNLVAIPNANSYNHDELGEVDIAQKEKIVLFVGLFSIVKREDRIVRIWKRIYKDFPDWKLVLVGSEPGEREDYIKSLAYDVPTIEFVGLKKALDYQKRASILTMTSSFEGWPLVLPESMQCGCVPIAFNSFAAVSEIINNHQDGILVKPFDLSRYEYQLRKLMSDDTHRESMAKSGMKNIKRFDASRIVNEWVKLFQRL